MTNQINNQSIMTTEQVVETSVTVNNNSPIQDYVHPDDQTQPFEMTPGFKPFTVLCMTKFIPLSVQISVLIQTNDADTGEDASMLMVMRN